MAPLAVVHWLKQNYHKPQIDPEWLDACCTWIIEEYNLNPLTDVENLTKNVESQLLLSDLRDSMLHGTGLPANVSELTNTILHGPILVEIVAITEIGHSAYTLQNTRQVRLDRADLTGLALDGADEDEGPIPKYPRSMLRFELSDGATTLQAMEYRPLRELELGVTPLGYKMLINDVFIRRGIAFLEPKCVVMKGHQSEDREVMQDADFARGLRMRLGQPDPDPEDEPTPAPPLPVPPAQLPAAPPPVHENAPIPLPPPVGPAHISDNVQTRHRQINNQQPSSSSNSTLRSSYFSDELSNSGPSAVLARERLLSPTRRSRSIVVMDDDENTNRDGNLTGKQKAEDVANTASSDFGDDVMFMDDDFMLQLDRVEMKAMAKVQAPSASRISNSSQLATTRVVPADVITIEDDDDDDKENVPTRRVRRRIEPVIQGDVIDVSDSD